MIRILGPDAIDAVFDEQAQATMNTFGDCFGLFDLTDALCMAVIVTDKAPLGNFCCTREAGHKGFHIACGTRAVAVWDE